MAAQAPEADGGAGQDASQVPLADAVTCPIPPGEVHLWVVDLDATVPGADACLDAAERERAASYLSPRDGARFAASRGGLRLILGRYLRADPAVLRFRRRPGGRPELACQASPPLEFSLARSTGIAVVAISAGPVGTDLEAIAPRPGLADLAAARFGAAEAARIAGGCCAGTPLRSFYRHWTAREAWLKALGAGLTALRDAEFDCRNGPAVRIRGGGADVPPLSLHLPDVTPGHAAAVAAAGPVTACPLFRLRSVPQ